VQGGTIPDRTELPQRLFATGSCFSVLCEAPKGAQTAADDMDAAETAGDSEENERAPSASPVINRSWLVLFDYTTMLYRLFPGLGARGGRGPQLMELFNTLSVDELANVPLPREETNPRASAQRNSTLSNTGGPRSSVSKTKFAGGSMKGTIRSEVTAPGGATTARSQDSAVVRLTEENLRKIGKPGTQTAGGSMLSSPLSNSANNLLRPGGKVNALPENWQASVRRYLRENTSQKENRQTLLQKRMEQMRKEIGDA